jgi:acyl carrier protein
MMKKQDFFDEIIDALELDERSVNEKTPIHLTSIKILALIVFVDEKFEKQIKIVDLKDVKTISDLMKVIGTENFTD